MMAGGRWRDEAELEAQCGVGREGERSSKDSEWLQGEAPTPAPGSITCEARRDVRLV